MNINPDSLTVLNKCVVEPELADAKPEDKFQLYVRDISVLIQRIHLRNISYLTELYHLRVHSSLTDINV